MVLLWKCFCFTAVLLRYWCEILWDWCGISHGIAGGLQWYYGCGIAVAFLWVLGITAILLLVNYHYGIAVGWLWYCCDLAVGFLRLLRDCCKGCRDCCRIDVEFLWAWYGIFLYHCSWLLWYPYGIAVWFLWGLLGYSWGIVGGSLWYYFGIAVEMLWYCCDIAVGFLWDCFENAAIAVVTRLLWKSIEEVVRQFH